MVKRKDKQSLLAGIWVSLGDDRLWLLIPNPIYCILSANHLWELKWFSETHFFRNTEHVKMQIGGAIQIQRFPDLCCCKWCHLLAVHLCCAWAHLSIVMSWQQVAAGAHSLHTWSTLTQGLQHDKWKPGPLSHRVMTWGWAHLFPTKLRKDGWHRTWLSQLGRVKPTISTASKVPWSIHT